MKFPSIIKIIFYFTVGWTMWCTQMSQFSFFWNYSRVSANIQHVNVVFSLCSFSMYLISSGFILSSMCPISGSTQFWMSSIYRNAFYLWPSCASSVWASTTLASSWTTNTGLMNWEVHQNPVAKNINKIKTIYTSITIILKLQMLQKQFQIVWQWTCS